MYIPKTVYLYQLCYIYGTHVTEEQNEQKKNISFEPFRQKKSKKIRSHCFLLFLISHILL